jgi:xylan 1,4-beta-xylosidase
MPRRQPHPSWPGQRLLQGPQGDPGAPVPLHRDHHDGERWEPIGPGLDASLLSDEYATRTVRDRITNWGFTGSVIGLAAQDLTGGGLSADFDFFDYTKA